MLNNGFILSDVLVLPLLYCFIKNMEWGGGGVNFIEEGMVKI